MAWISAAAGAGEWMVIDTDREPEFRIVAKGMSWLDAETWCAVHAQVADEYVSVSEQIDRNQFF